MTAPEARLGRWVLLYGILQVLSTISVDTAGLKYKDKVRYYIGPSLEGCPPWRSPEAAPLMIEACQQRSYCWLASQTWTDARVPPGGAASPPGYSNHQYELTESVSVDSSPDSEATSGAPGMHRNPSILQTAMNSAGTSSSPVGSRTQRGLGSPNVLRGPSLNPMRSPLASPSVMTNPLVGSSPVIGSASPLSSGSRSNTDDKADYDDHMMRAPSQQSPMQSPPSLALPNRNARRISPASSNRVASPMSPMSPLSLDGVANSSLRLGEVATEETRREHHRRDEGPPQLAQFSFTDDDNVI
jgi:hypothetical protein